MKKTFGVVLLMAIAITTYWNFNQIKNEKELTELALANINALARNEGDDIDCLTQPGSCFKKNLFYPYEEDLWH